MSFNDEVVWRVLTEGKRLNDKVYPHEPAIGVILAESMNYLSSGYWWLAFYPGMSLLIVVLLFDFIGENVERLLNPETAQE